MIIEIKVFKNTTGDSFSVFNDKVKVGNFISDDDNQELATFFTDLFLECENTDKIKLQFYSVNDSDFTDLIWTDDLKEYEKFILEN